MKNHYYLLLLCIWAAFSSCIKDEEKNKEADIEEVYFAPEDEVQLLSTPTITNTAVTIVLPQGSGQIIAPRFTLTEGATIVPASGTELDFSQPQKYTVTSEDRRWSKEYTVRVSYDMKLKYDFESVDRHLVYDIFFEKMYDDQGQVAYEQYIWSSGNGALVFINLGKPRTNYPTSAIEMIGPKGETSTVARLITKSTGKWGEAAKMPIAAGNLFIGWFNAGSAMGDPLGATEFGYPINKKPKALKGWYQYRSGNLDYKGNESFPPDRPDSCDIYAVLYKSDDGSRLNGSNILTSDRVVAKAIFKAPSQTLDGRWMPFENKPADGRIDFEYIAEVDEDALAQSKYNLAVVFSSSRKGAYFIGAVDSELLIDDVEVIVE